MRWQTRIGLALAVATIAAPAQAAEGAVFAAFRDVCGSPDMAGDQVDARLARAGFKRGSPDKPFPLLVGGKLYSKIEDGTRVTAAMRYLRKTDGRYWTCGVQVSTADQNSLDELERWIGIPSEIGVGFGLGGEESIYSFAQRGAERMSIAADDDKAINAAFRDRSFRRVYAELGPSITTIVVVAAVH
jgi:hypothetical protein